MISTRSLNEADFHRQAHLGHALKAAIAIQTGAEGGEFLEHAAPGVVIFHGLKIVSAPADTWALIHDDAIRSGRDELLAGMAFLLTRVVILALLLVFRLALGLFDA